MSERIPAGIGTNLTCFFRHVRYPTVTPSRELSRPEAQEYSGTATLVEIEHMIVCHVSWPRRCWKHDRPARLGALSCCGMLATCARRRAWSSASQPAAVIWVFAVVFGPFISNCTAIRARRLRKYRKNRQKPQHQHFSTIHFQPWPCLSDSPAKRSPQAIRPRWRTSQRPRVRTSGRPRLAAAASTALRRAGYRHSRS